MDVRQLKSHLLWNVCARLLLLPVGERLATTARATTTAKRWSAATILQEEGLGEGLVHPG